MTGSMYLSACATNTYGGAQYVAHSANWTGEDVMSTAALPTKGETMAKGKKRCGQHHKWEQVDCPRWPWRCTLCGAVKRIDRRGGNVYRYPKDERQADGRA